MIFTGILSPNAKWKCSCGATACWTRRRRATRDGTRPAIDLIPKDIVICDWHYEKRADYPSVPVLLNKGFRVWPSGWQPLAGAQALSAFSRQQKNPRLVGYLCTTWGKVKVGDVADWPPLIEPLRDWK